MKTRVNYPEEIKWKVIEMKKDGYSNRTIFGVHFSHWWVLFFRKSSCVIILAVVDKYFIAIFLLVFGII
ncbi:hypothetical protein EXW62_04690 [Bacillus mycoides]|uniref:hypothetical protein n=1 Tax=Bacillus mycoides TaxID=1405 RepID=UPI001C0310A2|nr:hypothetical protein [Bacillus mycoides]QWH16422.1 hypothetical protein EXW62_04690 [Bacillus mycoides]